MGLNEGNHGTSQIAKIVFKVNFDGEIILSFNNRSKFLNVPESPSNILFKELENINTDFFKGTIIVEK